MHILSKLLGVKRPTIKKDDIRNFDKVSEFILWFIKNEPIANVVLNRSSNIIFNEGFRPISDNNNNPEILNPNIKSLAEWFIIKMFIDLNKLQYVTKHEFLDFIDKLDDEGKETLMIGGEISIKYDLSFDNFIYEKEIQKIPIGEERNLFKSSFLSDNIIGAEIKILVWLCHEYFNEWYKIPERRNL